ncbi:MAG: Hcp family type VI secretion system effector [Opitutaceae bacterium]
MAADYFLNIDGIQGDSTDSKYQNQIELDSWSWNESQQGGQSTGAGLSSGKVAMSDFSFAAKSSKASPNLFLNCASGAHIKTAQLTCRKAGGKQQEYLKLNFTDILISSYNINSTAAGDALPVDSVTIKFSSLKFEFSSQKADGSLASPTITGWSSVQNKKL